MKTFLPTADPHNRRWVVIDLQGATLGRVAVKVADMLRGKDKPTFTPHIDMGDHVVAINAAGLKVTGSKLLNKFSYTYTGYPGGLRKHNLGNELNRRPDEAFTLTIRGMLPKNKLGRKMIKKLHVYAGSEHPHAAQQPPSIELKRK